MNFLRIGFIAVIFGVLYPNCCDAVWLTKWFSCFKPKSNDRTSRMLSGQRTSYRRIGSANENMQNNRGGEILEYYNANMMKMIKQCLTDLKTIDRMLDATFQFQPTDLKFDTWLQDSRINTKMAVEINTISNWFKQRMDMYCGKIGEVTFDQKENFRNPLNKINDCIQGVIPSEKRNVITPELNRLFTALKLR